MLPVPPNTSPTWRVSSVALARAASRRRHRQLLATTMTADNSNERDCGSIDDADCARLRAALHQCRAKYVDADATDGTDVTSAWLVVYTK